MNARPPRLRVQRLVIVESRSPLRIIREVRLNDGLSIVWAEEFAARRATEGAGHGVGKTTFTLMLRAVLGDDGAAVKTMRNHMADHYGSGGIAAEILAGSERFAVFRSFSTRSFALRNATVEDLFAEGASERAFEFSDFVAEIGEQACLRHLPRRVLPVSGQAVEWAHVLCWIARDQGLGLRQFHEWRKDDGTGLQRKAKDPPALVRLVLGLLTDAESRAEGRIAAINTRLSSAREALSAEEQRSANIRAVLETQVRQWAVVSGVLPMEAADLFASSVENEIEAKTKNLNDHNAKDRGKIAELDTELAALAADIKSQDLSAQLARVNYEEALALRTQDETSLKGVREQRKRLLTLSGSCQYGAIAYDACSYVQGHRETISFTAQRDLRLLTAARDEHEENERRLKTRYDSEVSRLGQFRDAQKKVTDEKRELSSSIEKRLRQLGEGDSVRRTYSHWTESRREPETEKLRAARAVISALEREFESTQARKVSARQQMSTRALQISKRVGALAKTFGVNGRYVPTDEKRPFQMLGADGDAYTPLEILLGDLACAEEGAKGNGAHPGLLIFDCPRERELSGHLYEIFLTLVDEVCRAAPGLQVILTTTTPPPATLREPPTRVLRLSRARDGDLLLMRRVENLLNRSTTSSGDGT